MKKTIVSLLLFPYLSIAQEDKRASLLISTSQGFSIVNKEALSNTRERTYPMTPGYAFSVGSGISIVSKKGKRFSDIKLTYKSYSNGIKRIVSPQDVNGRSQKTSSDRFNYLSLGYTYSEYIFKIKNYKNFISIGIAFSYILNRKMKLEYDKNTVNITVKGKNISDNSVITTPPSFTLGYGVDLGKGISSIGKNSRVSLNLMFDRSLLKTASPSNQYFTTMLNYCLIF